jgi:hypothetical protein
MVFPNALGLTIRTHPPLLRLMHTIMDLIACAQGILRRPTNPAYPPFPSPHAESKSPPAMPLRPRFPTMLILPLQPPRMSLNTMLPDHQRNHLHL